MSKWHILSKTVPTQEAIPEKVRQLQKNPSRNIKIDNFFVNLIFSFISGELNIDPTDVESLLVSCILDSTIYGRIDQVGLPFGAMLYLCTYINDVTLPCKSTCLH